MNNSVNIFFSVSKAYIQHFTVAVTSLLEKNKDLNFNLFVLHDNEDIAVYDTTSQFIKLKYSAGITFINAGNIDLSEFETSGYYPKYTYYRLFLADLAPGYVEKALFLDVDLVVTGSIKELTEIDLTGHYICAASEASVNDNVERLNKLGFPAKGYFNAGVILINVKAWREEKLSQKFIAIAAKYMDQLQWVDQDILNIYFAGAWCKFDSKYNSVHLIRKRETTPVIVHYASYSKPWYYVDTHPYNYLYWEYLRLTPFKRAKPVNFSLKNAILKNGRLLKRGLRELGILKYK